MIIQPLPTNLGELSRNIETIIVDERSLMIGKTCEVIEALEPQIVVPVQEISVLFDRFVRTEKDHKELVRFRALLDTYDRLLTLSMHEIPSPGSHTFFGPLIEKVKKAYQSLPTEKTHPVAAELIDKYTARAQKPTKGVKDLWEESNQILTMMEFEKRHYDHFSGFSYITINTFLSGKFLNEFLSSEVDNDNGTTLTNYTIPDEMFPTQEDLEELSELNYGFALLFFETICYRNITESFQKIDTDFTRLSKRYYLKFIKEIRDFLSSEAPMTQKHRDFLTFLLRMLTKNYMTDRDAAFGKKSKKASAELILESSRAKYINFAHGNPLRDELSYFELNNRVCEYSDDPNTPDDFDINFLLEVQEYAVATEMSFEALQRLYELAYQELFKVPSRDVPTKEKMRLYSLRKLQGGGDNFPEPAVFFKSLLSPPSEVKDDSQASGPSSFAKPSDEAVASESVSSSFLPPDLLKKKEGKKKAPIQESPKVKKEKQKATVPEDSKVKKEKQKAIEPQPALKTEEALTTPSHGITYDQRVLDYFNNPEEVLSGPMYEGQSQASKERSRIFHTFAQAVDAYVFSHGIKSTWRNEKRNKDDIQYSIPGEITIDGQTTRGIFTYCFDENGICYHRFLAKKERKDAMREYMQKGFWNADFPPLSASKEKEKAVKPKPLASDGSFLSKEVNSFTDEILDPRNNAIIRLYKIKAFTE